jgi:formyltetrahydrofolate synthetase
MRRGRASGAGVAMLEKDMPEGRQVKRTRKRTASAGDRSPEAAVVGIGLLPGLAKKSNALKIDIADDGKLSGLS